MNTDLGFTFWLTACNISLFDCREGFQNQNQRKMKETHRLLWVPTLFCSLSQRSAKNLPISSLVQLRCLENFWGSQVADFCVKICPGMGGKRDAVLGKMVLRILQRSISFRWVMDACHRCVFCAFIRIVLCYDMKPWYDTSWEVKAVGLGEASCDETLEKYCGSECTGWLDCSHQHTLPFYAHIYIYINMNDKQIPKWHVFLMSRPPIHQQWFKSSHWAWWSPAQRAAIRRLIRLRTQCSDGAWVRLCWEPKCRHDQLFCKAWINIQCILQCMYIYIYIHPHFIVWICCCCCIWFHFILWSL